MEPPSTSPPDLQGDARCQQTMMVSSELRDHATGSIHTGNRELDKSIGGGIPYRTLMLIEGQSAAGKSTLSQQLIWGALTAGENAALYTTEQTVQSFLRQMSSLGEDVSNYFLLNHLQIFPLSIPQGSIAPAQLFRQLNEHIAQQTDCRIVVVDSLTTIISQADGGLIQEFFQACKTLCEDGKVIICTVHSNAFAEDILTRVRSICDAHIRLKVQNAGSKLFKTIEVAKIRGAEMATGTITGFEVEPGLGLRIIPISQARA